MARKKYDDGDDRAHVERFMPVASVAALNKCILIWIVGYSPEADVMSYCQIWCLAVSFKRRPGRCLSARFHL